MISVEAFLSLSFFFLESGEIRFDRRTPKFLCFFNAYSNSFTGALPKDLVHLRFLEQLNLGGSYFGGTIPPSYGDFARLKFLDLAGNLYLQGPIPPQVSGTLAPEFGNLTMLEELLIFKRWISGEIPASFGNLKALKSLDLSENQLSGTIPKEIATLEGLTRISLLSRYSCGKTQAEFKKNRAIAGLQED
jgi:hypothetical protein